MNKLYPLGTVVTLKGAVQRVMIMGYYPWVQDEKMVTRYQGVIYPLGLSSEKCMVMFEDEMIEAVEYVRFADKDTTIYLNKLYHIMEEKGLKDKMPEIMAALTNESEEYA